MAIPRSLNPRGSVTTPKPAVKVPTSVRTRGASTQRAVAATSGAPRLGASLSQDLATYRAGPPQEMLSQRQYAREQRQTAEEKYYGMEPYKGAEFTEEAPQFDPTAVQRMLPSLMIVSLFGGKLSKLNALTQMKALNSAVEGYNQGNVDAHKRAMEDWRQAYNEFTNREAARRNQYQIDREARKDGLQLALNRQADADKAVNDYEQGVANNINMQLALNNERRAAEMHGANIFLRESQALAATQKGGAKKKSTLTADQKNKAQGAARLLSAVDTAIKTMETRPQDFSTAINAAFVASPTAAELFSGAGGPLTSIAKPFKAAIPSQQDWRRALNIKIVQDAGMSQTVQEMKNQLAAAGSQTLGGRKSGMAGIKVSILENLRTIALQDEDAAALFEKELGMSVDEALKQARDYKDRVDAEARGETTQAGGREEISKAEYDELIKSGYTPQQIRDEGYYVRGQR